MRLAVIPGDGIGPEVVAEGLKVLREVVSDVEATTYDLGAGRWHRTGELIPDSVIGELHEQDAILLGAVGDPSVPPGVLERGLLLRLRFELDHHVNLRPVRLFPGVPDAAGRQPGDRHGRGPGGHRGALLGGRRRAAQGHPARGRHRDQRQHGVRRRAGGPGRVPAGRGPGPASTSRWCTRPTC